MNLNFNILRKDSKGLFNIEMVGRINKQAYRWNTKIKVLEKEWDKKKQRHKKDEAVNNRLLELQTYANTYLLTNNITPAGFNKYMDEQTGRVAKTKDMSFFDVMRKIATNSRKRTNQNGEHICEGRVRLYENFTEQLKEFERQSHQRLSFDTLDKNTLDELKNWLTNERQLSQNTLFGRFRLLRTMLDEARQMGCDVNQDIRSYRIKTNKVENVVLTEEEVELMCNYKCDSERLQNVQDIFIIGVHTGLRFSDIRQLSKDKIHNGNIEVHQQKTSAKVVIPLHPSVEKMLNERGLPHVITGQKYNIYLRELAKLAGVNELVEIKKTKAGKRIIIEKEKNELISSHTCRRTFATLLYKKGVNPKLIMMLTGHKQLSTFMNYIIVDNKDAVNAVKESWCRNAI